MKNNPSTPSLPDLSYLKVKKINLDFYLLVSLQDEYHFLVNEDDDSPWVQMFKEARTCTLTRGLNARGMRCYQLDFLDEDDCLIHRLLNEIPDVPEGDVLEQQMFDWHDHLTTKRLSFWKQVDDLEYTHLGDLGCTLIRADSVPYDYDLGALVSSDWEAWPYDLYYPYWEEWMLPRDDSPEGDEFSCQPIYTEPVYYDFNSGLLYSISDHIKRAIPHYCNTSLTHWLKDGTQILFKHKLNSETGQCFVSVLSPDRSSSPLIAIMGTAWDKKYQDDFFDKMIEELTCFSDCMDWYTRQYTLNLEAVGKIPLIGTVYLQEIDSETKSLLEQILIRYGLGIIQCYCPQSLPKN